jgi:hypothetical protein
MADVIWALNYDVAAFDAVWRFLHEDVPDSPERARAIGAAALMALAELDRTEYVAEGVAAFDAAIPYFPDDARLPLWRATLFLFEARALGRTDAIAGALDGIRPTTMTYGAFTLFGVTLSTGGDPNATPAMLEEAAAAFDEVVADTARLQGSRDPLTLERSRRIWDTPIAPNNIAGMQAMIGDLALRRGDKTLAQRSYYTAIWSNAAFSWPWRAEVERRLNNTDAVAAGFTDGTEYALGSAGINALGVPKARAFSSDGRIGNGSCTVCHSHVTEPPAVPLGFIRGRHLPVPGIPNAQPIAFALPDGKDPRPAGFGIGPFVPPTAARDFYNDETLYDGTFVIAVPPGRYFIALQTSFGGKDYEGYSARELGLQRFVDVAAGEEVDLTDSPIELRPK